MEYNEWIQKLGDSAPNVSHAEFSSRARELANEGFLEYEIFWLSQHYMDSPGAQAMRQDRLEKINDARRADIEPGQFAREIDELYDANDWHFKDGQRDPFKMLDHFIRQVGDPNYPQKKARHGDRKQQASDRKGKRDKSSTRTERGDEKYPRGAAYH